MTLWLCLLCRVTWSAWLCMTHTVCCLALIFFWEELHTFYWTIFFSRKELFLLCTEAMTASNSGIIIYHLRSSNCVATEKLLPQNATPLCKGSFNSNTVLAPTDICWSRWASCTSGPSRSLGRTSWRTWWRCVVVFSIRSVASSSETTCCSAPATSCQMMESRQSKNVESIRLSAVLRSQKRYLIALF